ncbi:MAG: 2-succinyl-5-enolpyruvyl-6-hydroxy-3-cyclohexene-1-carboxylic-acid synthase [Nocardioidaceae bacterium]|nr:2-succinyl-5-enolpyruvyl-6-hydroxy-3-cyclohexene-1-carboxylic-acid synthase [Nocardioidaceae bacterium]
MNESGEVAVAVVSALQRAGVTDVVLAPGSRSAALAMAVHECDALGLLRLHVRIDERTAAFLALGLGKGSHRPVAVVTTSGTAVANLHPAVLEAHHCGERLVVLSADRPALLRGTGANQTTHQPGMFGSLVPAVDVEAGDAAAAAVAIDEAGRRRGPSHINVQFADPLLPPEVESFRQQIVATGMGQRGEQPGAIERTPVRLELGPRTVVVAGDDSGPQARLLAQGANWPLLAEPTSGARTGTHALRTYRLLLGTELGGQIERVIVTGHPTLSRPVTDLISRPDLEVISVRGRSGICTDPGMVARHLDDTPVVQGRDPDGWIQSWREADQQVSAAVDRLAATSGGLPLQVAGEVAAAVPAQGLLFVGSSQPIRDLDVMMTPYPAGERRLIIGNRGLSGIDGTVSSALGAALGRRSPRAIAYVGDLTFLHDATGLVIGPDEPRPDLTIVVVNDDGGAIFSTLEQGTAPYTGSFERIFGAPHAVSVRALCEATRTSYDRVDDAFSLKAALAHDVLGIRVLEVAVDRRARRALHDSLLAMTAER